MNGNIVWNAVLSFVSRAMLSGIKHRLIIHRTVEFLSRDNRLSAKEISAKVTTKVNCAFCRFEILMERVNKGDLLVSYSNQFIESAC